MEYKTKCDFCKYHTASGCTTRPNSYYCKDALDEFYAYLRNKNTQKGGVKSLYNKNRRGR